MRICRNCIQVMGTKNTISWELLQTSPPANNKNTKVLKLFTKIIFQISDKGGWLKLSDRNLGHVQQWIQDCELINKCKHFKVMAKKIVRIDLYPEPVSLIWLRGGLGSHVRSKVFMYLQETYKGFISLDSSKIWEETYLTNAESVGILKWCYEVNMVIWIYNILFTIAQIIKDGYLL